MDAAQFKTLLYSASYQSLKQPSSPYVIALNKTDAGKHTLTYLQYAKELEPYAQLSENDGWWDMKRAASFGRDVRPLQKQRAGTLPALPIS